VYKIYLYSGTEACTGYICTVALKRVQDIFVHGTEVCTGYICTVALKRVQDIFAQWYWSVYNLYMYCCVYMGIFIYFYNICKIV
jgi:hypothetical protein